MSVNPVTITITTEDSDGEIQHGLARATAAADLGLDPDQIVCLEVRPVQIISPVLTDPDPETGIKSIAVPAKYTFESCWAPKHVEPKPKEAAPIEWPKVTLPRGARWHGTVPGEDGTPIEENLISTGDRLVLIDSAEGKLLMNEMGGEKPTTTILPANTFE